MNQNQNQNLTPLPSPLSYTDAVSRPEVAPKTQRDAKLRMIALMLMESTGCSRKDAMDTARAMVKQIEEAQNGQ